MDLFSRALIPCEKPEVLDCENQRIPSGNGSQHSLHIGQTNGVSVEQA